MRLNVALKGIFYCLVIFIIILVHKTLLNIKLNRSDTKIIIELSQKEEAFNTTGNITVEELKYILLWTSENTVPFVYMGKGRQVFIERKCVYTNCFVTANRSLLGNYTKFDVIAFAATELVFYTGFSDSYLLPAYRSPHQKYAFASIESADNYPVCYSEFDNFFNWTWTYRLNSDARWGYIVIRDLENNIVGPKVNMHWIDFEDMKPASQDLKNKLRSKTKAAAWFVSNCLSGSDRESFARALRVSLAKYDLQLDIYGRCTHLNCTRDKDEECNKMIEDDYYFYLAFENSFAEDYVTEKLLRALKYYAVPVVYGGANYTRFMPDGIYLNARVLGVEKVAVKMYELIENPEKYAEYFRWRNHYSYHGKVESIETDDYCRFCDMLNDDDLVKKTTVYEDFQMWWSPPGRCRQK